MQCEEDWLVMHTLHTAHGWSIARLAREFGVNWRTARRYATAEVPPGYGPRPCPAGLTEAQLAHVRRRLELCPELRATTLFREVRELGDAGSYPSFARRVRDLRPGSGEIDPPFRFETGPDLQAQGDWAHCGRWLLGGGLVELHALVVVLRWRRGLHPGAIRPACFRPSVGSIALLQPSPFSSSGRGLKARPTGVIIPVVAK